MTQELPILRAEQLMFSYPGQKTPALSGVDLHLIRGQAVGLLGPNGSGKSTLIDVLMGLRKAQSGRVDHSGDKPLVIAWVPQEYAFYPDLTCYENLRFFAGMLDMTSKEAARRTESAISSCLLQNFANKRARHCSGGVRRRLNLGIALLQRPDVLLLDEPTVGVDPQSRSFLLEHVKSLVNSGTAVLYATHYMEEVSAVCSNILLLDHGRVLASGKLESLLINPEDASRFSDLEALFLYYTRQSLRD